MLFRILLILLHLTPLIMNSDFARIFFKGVHLYFMRGPRQYFLFRDRQAAGNVHQIITLNLIRRVLRITHHNLRITTLNSLPRLLILTRCGICGGLQEWGSLIRTPLYILWRTSLLIVSIKTTHSITGFYQRWLLFYHADGIAHFHNRSTFSPPPVAILSIGRRIIGIPQLLLVLIKFHHIYQIFNFYDTNFYINYMNWIYSN